MRPKITFFPTLDVKVFRGERSKKLPPFLSFRSKKKARKGDKMVKLFHNRISSLLLWTRLPSLNLIKNILFHFSWHTKNGKVIKRLPLLLHSFLSVPFGILTVSKVSVKVGQDKMKFSEKEGRKVEARCVA